MALTTFAPDSEHFEVPGKGLGIVRGGRLDLDGDGLEDVVLFTSAESGDAKSFVHYGKCPRLTDWSYQYEWAGRLTEAGAEEFEAHAMVVARGDGDEDRLVAIGETAAGPRLASYVIRNGVPSETSEFAEPIPQSGGSVCRDAEAPFSLVAGNFDEDDGRSDNDVAFSDANQAWRYLVGTWGFPTDWNVTCAGGNVTGGFPDQLSDPGERIGLLSVRRAAPLLDELLEIGSGRVDWSGYGSFSVSLTNVMGMGEGRVALDDGRPDLILWDQELPDVGIASIELKTVNGDVQRSLAVTLTSVSLEATRPKHASLLHYENQDYVALLAGSTLH